MRGEPIIGIVPMVRKKTGILSCRTYDLLVTDRRVIFAVITKEMANQAVRGVAEEPKARGRGLLERIADKMRWHDRVIEGYYRSSPDEILMRNEGNYCLDSGQIEWAMLTVGHFDHDSGNQKDDELVMKTAEGKIKMSLRGTNVRSVRDLLSRAGIRVR